MAGLTTTGFTIPTMEEIREDINQRLRAAFSQSLDLSDGTIEGQLVGIIAERLSVLWETAEVVYSAMDPDKAATAALDAICAITGTTRLPPTYTTVTLVLTGTPATVVAALSKASTGSTEFLFETDEQQTIGSLSAWAGTTAYVVGDMVTNASRVYYCITAGTSDGSGGPTTTALDITDNTAHWAYLGEGTGAVEAAATADVTGPYAAPAFSVTTQITQGVGFLGVSNPAAGTTGSNVQTDENLRVLREQEVQRPGTSPLDAIRAAILDVEGVTSVTMFENPTDTTDADGMPPHSVEAMVEGGEDQDIWDALLANVAAGIRTHGDEVGTANDSQGTAHTRRFSRPTEVPIWLTITYTYDAEEYPVDGDDQSAEAIVDYGNGQKTGRDAVATALQSRAFALDIGVLGVTSCLIGLADPPVASTDITITSRQKATYALARTVVNSSAGTP